MVYYVHTRTGKKQKKKEGFLKSRSVEIVATDLLKEGHTLSRRAEKIHNFIIYRYGGIPEPKKPDAYNSKEGIRNAITHTHQYFVNRGKDHHIHRSFEDAQKWTILLQLMSLWPTLREGIQDYEELGKRTEKILEELEKEFGEPIYYYTIGNGDFDAKLLPNGKVVLPKWSPKEGNLLPEFEKIKRDPAVQEKFIDAFLQAHNIPDTQIQRERAKKLLQKAIEAAEDLARFFGKKGKDEYTAEDLEKVEKFREYMDTLMWEEFSKTPEDWRITPKKEQQKPAAPASPQVQAVPKKPTFPETKKAVEEGLRTEGIPNSLTLETHKLLGILNGLKFADYSENAIERALRELDSRVDELMREKNLELLGLYLGFQRLLERRDFEGAEEFLRGLS